MAAQACLRLLWFLMLLPFTLAQQTTTQDVSNCTCGFYDEQVDMVFTDTSIVYYNETENFPSEFVLESFEHKYDLGWNAIYRQGAAVENVAIDADVTARNLTSLSLYCDPSDDNGLVMGASVSTARQDIFFGSFRASMRAPREWFKGSAISMLIHHNVTERWDIDVMNTDNSSWAWVSTLAKGQFSNLWLGTNFTNLLADGMDPWYYTEYRVDWTLDSITYYIGGVEVFAYTTALNGTLPSTPAPLKFQHWSLGNVYNTQGPPDERSEANIAWTRLFFNSSLTTTEEQQAFDTRCTPAAACRMDDNTLRGSSTYPPEALTPWQQAQPKYKIPWVPLMIDIAFASLFIILTTKTLWRRFTLEKLYIFLGIIKHKRETWTPNPSTVARISAETSQDYHSIGANNSGSENTSLCLPRDSSYSSFQSPPTYSGAQTPLPQYQTPIGSQWPSRVNSSDDLSIVPLPRTGSVQSDLHMRGAGANSLGTRPPLQPGGYQHYSTTSNPFLQITESGPSTPAPEAIPPFPIAPSVLSSTPSLTNDIQTLVENPEAPEKTPQAPAAAEKRTIANTTVTAPAATTGAKWDIPAQQRVDYLAGFVGMSALLVTMNHFGLTFFAAVIIPSVRPHYSSETWARKTIASYFLDPLWIGPFLMISTRFLVSNYLRSGRLDNMAQKIVSRPFRLLTPVASIAMLEYFLMDAGALNWLDYLPSVTWSPWPFTAIVANPGVYISEIIQLAYLIPNAAPMITYNYCTGVLWTIPVQLQGAWQTLLALIMVKECKTPWKRFAFYAFCIANHWYGLSWGSYYYVGVLLADLDITFKYKKWLYVRPFVYYPFLWFLIALALGGFTIDMVTQWTGVQYAEVEYGWHPDIASGVTISQSGNSVYPDYFIPRLNALLTTVAMQTIVEINPTVQKALSSKVLQLLFPHIFTIYLIHGFIFWSIGSWAMIGFFSHGLPYWLCLLLTFIVCYATLFASLPILTPPIELLGKKFTLSLWEHASQEPPPRNPTTFPFGKELLKRDVDGAAPIVREPPQPEKAMSFPNEKEIGKVRAVETIKDI
jgi:hypothetical protein